MTAEAVNLQATPLAPVAPKDRVFTLDMLRGLAILGILAVNAISFAWPVELMMAEQPPTTNAGHYDMLGYWAVDVFFQDKFRSLFSMLFGVSVFLVGGEIADRMRGKLLVRRLLWLGLFGLIHGLVFWYGDILFHYAYCGLILMLMRSWSAKRLLWVGFGVTLAWGLLSFLMTWGMANMPAEFAAQMEQGQPGIGAVAPAIEAYVSSGHWLPNAMAWAMFQLMISPFMALVTVPLMMIGLGLFKTGFLSGKAPVWVYGLFILIGGANLAAFASLRWQDLAAGEADPTGGLGNALGSFAPFITLFYVSVLILLARFGLKFVVAPLAPVGRMAFTNYLTQTLIMTSLYYMPWGPQWFGQHGSFEMWQVVGAIWLAQLIWSPLWLSVFQMGPLEWLWRCLTYGRFVPLAKAG